MIHGISYVHNEPETKFQAWRDFVLTVVGFFILQLYILGIFSNGIIMLLKLDTNPNMTVGVACLLVLIGFFGSFIWPLLFWAEIKRSFRVTQNFSKV